MCAFLIHESVYDKKIHKWSIVYDIKKRTTIRQYWDHVGPKTGLK